jgi:HK97 family phage prohead protease
MEARKNFPVQCLKRLGTPGTCATFTAVICAATVDRDGDLLDPRGANVDVHLALLWQHDAQAPVGKLLAITKQDADVLSGDFALADNDLGRDCAKLIELGVLRISHGFVPTEYAPRLDAKGKQTGWDVKKFDVLEVSLVSVPSNVNAVITSFTANELKSAAVKLWVKSLGDTNDTGAQLRDKLAERLGRGEITTDQYVTALKADNSRTTDHGAASGSDSVSDSELSPMDRMIERSVEHALTKGNFMDANSLIAQAPSGDSNGGGRVRVKNVSEKFCTKRREVDWNKHGFRPKGFGGAPVEENSEWDNARFGVFARHLARKSGISIERTSWDDDIMADMIHTEKWNGEIGGQYTTDIAPQRVKTLLDDVNPASGGDYINPFFFDEQLIVPALLTGEVFPFVELVNIPRASSVHTGVMAIPTVSWDTSEGTAGTEYSTGDMINLLTSSIQAVAMWIEIGLDFLADTPINLGAFLTRVLGERLAAELDRVVAIGSPSNGEPLGMFNTPGYTVVTDANGSAGPATVGDVEGLIFALAKQYRTKANAPRFLMNDAMYRKYRAIPTATGWNTRAFDFGLQNSQSYYLFEYPVSIQNDIPLGSVAFAAFNRYRMYRRLGLQMRWSLEGRNLMLSNTTLLSLRARYGGQQTLGATIAAMTGVDLHS